MENKSTSKANILINMYLVNSGPIAFKEICLQLQLFNACRFNLQVDFSEIVSPDRDDLSNVHLTIGLCLVKS